MKLEFDPSDRPVTHALVIGVSQYRHIVGGEAPNPEADEFGLEQLTSAAASASAVAAWLHDHYHHPEAPLATLRVLLAPSPGEAVDQRLQNACKGPSLPTRENVERVVREFTADCLRDTRNKAFVYVVGHGVQLSKHGATLLLTDFGRPDAPNRLSGALDMRAFHGSLDHANAPARQVWFVDACRQQPSFASRFEALRGALAPDEPRGHTQASPLFLSSSTREAAFARRNGPTLFSEALLAALGGDAATGPTTEVDAWHVTVYELAKALQTRVAAAARGEQAEQNVEPTGRMVDHALQWLKAVPTVDVKLGTRPEFQPGALIGSMLHADNGTGRPAISAWPHVDRLDAGLYLLQFEGATRPRGWRPRALDVKPPRLDVVVEVQL